MPDTAEAAQRTHAQVQDAYELASYVVENGIKDESGQPLAFDNIKTIEATAAMLGIIAVNGDGPKPVTAAQWADFEQAYYALALATSPVTAETLRNTRYVAGAGMGTATGEAEGGAGLRGWWAGKSPAQRFTRVLWGWTTAFALFVLASQVWIEYFALQTGVGPWTTIPLHIGQALQPWAYGGLGACAYLLRSAHTLIHQRSFDLRRKPEYFNRILLGAVSGGAIILFTDYLSPPDETTAHLGATALGFIAGYSTDFLFNTVERVITALFPKVAVQTVPRDQSKKPATPPRPATPPKAGGGDGSEDPGKDGKDDGA
jgi:hypothetical protein